MKRLELYWHTIRYLRFRQVLYQVLNRFRDKPALRIKTGESTVIHYLPFPAPDKPVSVRDKTVTFLNRSVTFPDGIDWNYEREGRLWKYNLNYFDFLNQPGMNRDQGLALIRDFIQKTSQLKGGLEPYPTSLRVINWIRFLSYHRLQLPDVNAHLRAQVRLLENRLEYHLGGNHLLENAFALVIAALSFQDRKQYQKATQLLSEQLNEQILADGGHYERSPMYHQILLDRLLDICAVFRQNDWHQDPVLETALCQLAGRMLGWLLAVTFRNGAIPMVNDAAYGIAPTTNELIAKAGHLSIRSAGAVLSDSGYRMFRNPVFELLVDVGAVGPDHQPGHAHADTFSFMLYVRNQPVIVDPGTSTYEANARRQWERGTAAHNTVGVAGADSSEVWGGFRVARRARVTLLADSPTHLQARHNGYRKYGLTHERSWQCIGEKTVRLTDRLLGPEPTDGVARLFFHPSITISMTDKELIAGPLQIRFPNVSIERVKISTYEYAVAFNQLKPAYCMEVTFADLLKWDITVAE